MQAEDMQGVGGDAAEISALILDLAQSLKVDGERGSAAGSLKAIHSQLDQLLQQLPDSFFEPLISKDSLSSEQVGLAAQPGPAQAIATEPLVDSPLVAGGMLGHKHSSRLLWLAAEKNPHTDKLLPLLLARALCADSLHRPLFWASRSASGVHS